MSLNSDIKDRIINSFPADYDSASAALYALILTSFGIVFRGGGKAALYFESPHAPSVSFAFKLVKEVISFSGEISHRRVNAFGGRTVYRLDIPDSSVTTMLLHNYGIISPQGVLNLGGPIDTGLIPDEEAQRAFISAAFTGCGLIMEPSRGYEAQFTLSYPGTAESFREFIADFGIIAKTRQLKNDIIVYIKRAESVENLLAAIGETPTLFRMYDKEGFRGARARAVREGNMYDANVDRIAAASVRQREAIDALSRAGVLSSLSPALIEASRLRDLYPEESTGQLAQRAGVSRSAFAQRLNRLIELAKDIK
ncbi:MAG: DNA-binding protein WhiA [Eubacteriaceae bacterium]|nr:DNA-binding protein WhiA [Eubacteriaceae bacterium]